VSPTAPTRPRSAAARPSGPRSAAPTLREERLLLRAGHALVAGVDEVGRGALAGPVTVGVVVVTAATRSAPPGLRDSKLLTPAAREALAPRLRRWAPASAVGHAEPEEIDALGIVPALRLAGTRALASLPDLPDAVLLDGNHDWLTPRRPAPAPDAGPALELDLGLDLEPAPSVVDLRDDAGGPDPLGGLVLDRLPVVTTQIKADLRCAAVAAASVLAKVERDALMVARAADHPAYGWAENKGYSAPEHVVALERLGPCAQHRRSWRLPGTGAGGGSAAGPAQVQNGRDER
jgi:ribonuclease HII